MSGIEVTQTGEEQLSQQERDTLRRLFSFPEEIPSVFPSWMIEYMKINGQLDKRQISGLASFSVYIADFIATQEAVPVGQTSYGGIGTAGPSLTGLGDGLYIVLYGGTAIVGQEFIYMGVGKNGGAVENQIELGSASADINASSMTAYPIALSNGGNNSLLCQYKRFGNNVSAVYWKNRWMLALKYGTTNT